MTGRRLWGSQGMNHKLLHAACLILPTPASPADTSASCLKGSRRAGRQSVRPRSPRGGPSFGADAPRKRRSAAARLRTLVPKAQREVVAAVDRAVTRSQVRRRQTTRAYSETIYRALFASLLSRRKAKLRTGRTRRKKQRRGIPTLNKIKNMTLIHERPSEVNGHAASGHWEGERALRRRTNTSQLTSGEVVVDETVGSLNLFRPLSEGYRSARGM